VAVEENNVRGIVNYRENIRKDITHAKIALQNFFITWTFALARTLSRRLVICQSDVERLRELYCFTHDNRKDT
jgi:hypothetical protein